MEFRVWTEVLNTGSFDNHANNLKKHMMVIVFLLLMNILFHDILDDDKDLSSDTTIRDVSAKTTETQDYKVGFTENTFESVVDRTKSKVKLRIH